MSIESLNRTSDEIKTSNNDLDVLKQEVIFKDNHKRTCINALNHRLYEENKRDRNKSIIITCIIIFSVGIFGFIVT